MTDDIGLDQLLDWDLGYFTEPFFHLLGPVFPGAVAIGLMGVLYIYTGGLAMPTVVAMLIGSGIILYLPAEAQLIGQLLILAGISMAIYAAYDSSGGRRL